MTYKLKEHVTDEMLIAVDYSISIYGYAFKRNGVNEVYINLSDKESDVIGKKREILNMDFTEELNPDNIQDLIELGYVEVVE